MKIDVSEIFAPSKKIREMDLRKFIGSMVTIRLGHTDADKSVMHPKKIATSQYIYISETKNFPFHLSGWVDRVLGDNGDKIKKKITNMRFVLHDNGGRESLYSAQSYKEFFNKELCEKISKLWKGGFLARLLQRGDIDQADIITEFGEIILDSSCYAIVAPEEIYSDIHKNNPIFKFVDGFYEDVNAAIEKISQKTSDDLFGERYFPVIVFPVEEYKQALNICQWAKNWSKPIIVGDNIIIGLRCKPSEYANIIENTYTCGGKVPVGVEWNWED